MPKKQDAKLARLEQNPLFANCDSDQIRTIGQLGDLATLPGGAVIAREGRWSSEAVVVMEGTVIVSRQGEPLISLQPGDIIGETEALRPGPATTTATALTAVQLLVFDPRSFRSLLEVSSPVTRRMFTRTVRKAATFQRIADRTVVVVEVGQVEVVGERAEVGDDLAVAPRLT